MKLVKFLNEGEKKLLIKPKKESTITVEQFFSKCHEAGSSCLRRCWEEVEEVEREVDEGAGIATTTDKNKNKETNGKYKTLTNLNSGKLGKKSERS